jgi:hypothetical protein
VRLLLSSDSSHQSGKIPINTGITCIHFISTLSDLTSMGTASGYIVTQDLYIVWGLARGTLENSLWFSLARCESFFCFSLVILLFGFPLQVLSLWTLIVRLPLTSSSILQGGTHCAQISAGPQSQDPGSCGLPHIGLSFR